MITELAPDIFLLNIPLPGNPLKNLNSFFLRGSKRNLLVDTGFNMPESLEAMQAGLSELQADMSCTDIFLTHIHSDHIGLASTIAAPESKVYISAIDYSYLHGILTKEYWDVLDQKFLSFGFPKEELRKNNSNNPAFIYLPYKKIDYTPLENGHVIDLGNRQLETIWTPGHSPGHFCLFDKNQGFLFSGDHVIFDITPNITSWPERDDSLGDYLNSLEKIRNIEVRRVFSAHREVGGDLYKRIDELLEHHHVRLNEALQAVEQLKKATVYEVASIMKWSIRAKSWSDFPVAQKWFAVGEAHSHLEYLRIRSKLAMFEEKGLCYYCPIDK